MSYKLGEDMLPRKRVYNKAKIKMVNGVPTDPYGREFNTDWKEFDNLRDKRNTPAIASMKLK